MERRKHDIAIVIEVKDTRKFSKLDRLCDEALVQIEAKRYESELMQECYKKVIKYGISFCEKSCRVKKS